VATGTKVTGTILEKIIDTKHREVEKAKRARPQPRLQDEIARAKAPRDFYGRVSAARPSIRLIAEIKKASPSAGLIRPDFDAVAIAGAYESCGAAALSVLTDRTYFSGDLSLIAAVKGASSLPVLRKDFIVDEYQVLESRAGGADAILLIAGVLSPGQIRAYSALADDLGMTSLVEVHNIERLRGVRDLIDPQHRVILGINNRDLHTQTTDIRTTLRLAGELTPGTPFVSESGIKTRADVLLLQGVGATALLIGETFMRAANIGAKVRELMGRD
jgi:indole-3-glycerol phosphate synthase